MTFTNSSREVEAQITPLTMREAAFALSNAVRMLTARPPKLTTLCVLLAQSALETGRWKKIWCNNFGNKKAPADYEGFHYYVRCNEIIKGELKWFDPPHPQTRFCAFATAAAGAADHIAFLVHRTRYARAWAAAERGDPSEFCEELKRGGYFTAHLEPYRRAVVSLFNEFRTQLSVDPLDMDVPTTPPQPDNLERSEFSDEDFGRLISDLQVDLQLSDADWNELRRERGEMVKEP